LGMALDEPNDFDEVFILNEISYLIDKRLLPMIQPVTVDFNKDGFNITGRDSFAICQFG
jgi:hypothetical protein